MAPVKLKFVVSFTSQDDHHKVSNLTNSDEFGRKWLSHPCHRSGQIEAVFQLSEDCVISYMDIGVQWCASLEVQVGRSDWPQDREYLTILPTVSFMNPVESRNGTNHTRTRLFSNEDFSEDVCHKKWDRIKVICRQPFRKNTQFGLCFLRIGTKDVKNDGLDDRLNKNKSVKSIQKHFFGPTFQSKTPEDLLKSRLMKIAGSSENGIEHHEAIPRTAKLVLAASEGKKTPKLKDNIINRPALYSNHLEQKYGPQFEEEVTIFLANFEIDKDELDKVTIADIRHKFEKLKKRKLTQEEKKLFVKKARDHICDKFSNENSNEPTQHKISKSDTKILKPNKYGYNWKRDVTPAPKEKSKPGEKRNVMQENENIKNVSSEKVIKNNTTSGQDILSKTLLINEKSLFVNQSSECQKSLNDPDVRFTKTLVKKPGPLQNNSASSCVNSPCLKSTNDEWLSSASPNIENNMKRNGTGNHSARKRLLNGGSASGRGKRARRNSNDNVEDENVSSTRGRGRKNSRRGGSRNAQKCGGALGRGGTAKKNSRVGPCRSPSSNSSESTSYCLSGTPSSLEDGSGYSSCTSTPSSVYADPLLGQIDSPIDVDGSITMSASNEFVECPICCEFFSQDGIELHAQICCELNFN